MRKYSVIQQPIIISKSSLEQYVFNAIPLMVYSGTEKDGLPYDIKVKKGGTPKISFEGRSLSIKLPLKINVSKSIGFINATAEGEIVLDINSLIDVDTAWNLVTKTHLANYTWTEKPQLKVLGMSIPVSNMTEKLIEENKNDLLTEIDKVIYAQRFIRNGIDSILSQVSNPIQLDSSTNLFLAIRPVNFKLAPFSNDIKSIYSGIVLTSTVDIVDSNSHQDDIQTSFQFSWAENHIRKQEISISVDLEKALIQKNIDHFMMNSNRAEKQFVFRNKSIEIRAIDVVMKNEKIGAKLLVSGDYKGSINYLARPTWNKGKNNLDLCDTELKTNIKGIHTKLFLFVIKGAIKRRITKEIEQIANDNIETVIEQLDEKLKNITISKALYYNGNIADYNANPIRVEDEMLRLDMKLTIPGFISFKGLKLELPANIN